MLFKDNTARYFYVITFILLLMSMIVLLLKLECKHKNETKGEVESNEFAKYLFNNKSPMHKGFISSVVLLIFTILFVIVYEFFKLRSKYN